MFSELKSHILACKSPTIKKQNAYQHMCGPRTSMQTCCMRTILTHPFMFCDAQNIPKHLFRSPEAHYQTCCLVAKQPYKHVLFKSYTSIQPCASDARTHIQANMFCQNFVLGSSGKPLDRFRSMWMLFRCNCLPNLSVGPFWEPSHPRYTTELRPTEHTTIEPHHPAQDKQATFIIGHCSQGIKMKAHTD